MTNIDPEMMWDLLLSRNAALIKKTWLSLGESEQSAVLSHLIDMANKTGWMNQQTGSAKVAINVIAELKAETGEKKS
jgi:hypothetical protein